MSDDAGVWGARGGGAAAAYGGRARGIEENPVAGITAWEMTGVDFPSMGRDHAYSNIRHALALGRGRGIHASGFSVLGSCSCSLFRVRCSEFGVRCSPPSTLSLGTNMNHEP